jgi:hypothetical protein
MGPESPPRMGSPDRSFGEAIAEVARRLEAEGSAQQTLQKMVELAVATIAGCDHAGVSIINEAVQTPAGSDDVPHRVDELQYDAGEGRAWTRSGSTTSSRPTICAARSVGRTSAHARRPRPAC